MTAFHLSPENMRVRYRAIATRLRKAGATEWEIDAAQCAAESANPRLVHLLLGGAVACGRPLTADEFATGTVGTLDAATCRRCHAAATALETAEVSR